MNKAGKLEVLLPAGDVSSIQAAVFNGADAVYLGGKNFSARQNAKNFDKNGLREAVSYCHARNVLVYQTINTLFFDRQTSEIEETLREACDAGADALIVQDWGTVYLAQKLCPQMRLHASTQMAVHTLRGAKLLEEMGLCRVVLARELSLKEIADIAQNTSLETEVFVHGALCMSLSGQCYMSGMLGGRSGNRGNCAGTCRLPFSLDGKEDYALSLKDNCLAAHKKELEAIGVDSLKIEGRMKRPEYVAAAAGVYSQSGTPDTESLNELRSVFSRSGFTDAYLTGRRDAEMFGYRQKEDVLAASNELLKKLQNTYQKEIGRIPLKMHLTVARGKKMVLTVTDPSGNQAVAEGDCPQEAIHRMTEKETLVQAMKKLGATMFFPEEVSVDLNDGLYISASQVNGLRREAVMRLASMREKTDPIPFQPNALNELQSIRAGSQKLMENPKELFLRARFFTFEQLSEDVLSSLSGFSLPLWEFAGREERLKQYQKQILIEAPRGMFGKEDEVFKRLSDLKKQGFTQLLCNNIAHLQMARELSLHAFAGPFLNCTNSFSAAELYALGAEDITLSFELNLKDASQISTPLPKGMVLYGYLPLMLFRSCPVKRKLTCKECQGKQELIDRKGIHFPVLCSKKNYSELLNSVVLYLGDRLSEFSCFSHGTLYFTREDADECKRIIRCYQQGSALDGLFTRGLAYRII